MFISELNIHNFKGLSDSTIEFCPKINCFLGNNGMGKTNLLDAIHYLSFCRSHLKHADKQLITHDENFFMLKGEYNIESKKEIVSCSYSLPQDKVFKRNNKTYDRLSEHYGFLPLVIISPSDSEIIGDTAEYRRHFLDSVISQFDSHYLASLISYKKAVSSRNNMLKTRATDETLYETIEAMISNYAEVIFKKRAEFIEDISPIFVSYYQSISNEYEIPKMSYQSQLKKGSLEELLKQSRQKDIDLGYTSIGTHRDDIKLELNGYPVRKEGSQGQNKTFLVALKFAQYKYLYQKKGIRPILLLDDIFDKLDKDRVENIIRTVSNRDFGQIFITDTNREHINEVISNITSEYSVFLIERGAVTNIETDSI